MNLKTSKAQAVTELAIFGLILIFVIGGILRNAADVGMTQNQMLKAMRYAMLQSLTGVRTNNKSRITASVIYLEDRLTPDAGKVGSIERSPLLQSASAKFTNNMFMPLDWGETDNLPVSDFFINGAHFVFSTARFIVYELGLNPANPNQVRVRNITTGVDKFYPKNGNWKDNCTANGLGCPLFYTVVPANSSKFCVTSCADNTITLDQRFDLNRNNIYGDDPQGAQRTEMSWQWSATPGLSSKITIDTENGDYPVFDVDGDRKDETIYRVDTVPGSDVIQRVYVIDSDQGDINTTYDDLDVINGGPSPTNRGLLRPVSIYTQTKDGTYLEINEGKAFVPSLSGGSEFVRSATRKDQVDVISRMIKLDNNTGRFCNGTTRVNSTAYPNPVEFCVNSKVANSNCFTPATISAICYDVGINTIFVRSRIGNQGGRKWVTRTK